MEELPVETDELPVGIPVGVLVSELPPVITVPVIGIGRLRVDERLAAALVLLDESIAFCGVPAAVVV